MNPATNTQPNIMPMYPGIHQTDEAEDGPNLPKAPLNTLLGFDLETYQIPLDALMPSKRIPDGVMSTRKYKQIVSSIHEIGLIEPLSVIQHDPAKSEFILLDGHLRVLALKDLGINEAPCLIAKDDETYTYNHRINRLSTIQEHYMTQYKDAEQNYGSDLLNLVVAKGYLTKLVGNDAVKSFISRHEPEILEQFELVVNTVSMEEAVQQQQELAGEVEDDLETDDAPPIRSTRGVSRLVSFGVEPAKVDDRLIEILRTREAAAQAEPERLFTQGERVRLSDRAFVGIEGVYQMADGERRVMVLIELMGKPVVMKVDAVSLQKVI